MKQAGIRHVFFALCVGLALPALASAAFAGASADSIAGKVRVVPNPWCASDQAQHYAKRTGNSIFDVRECQGTLVYPEDPVGPPLRLPRFGVARSARRKYRYPFVGTIGRFVGIGANRIFGR